MSHFRLFAIVVSIIVPLSLAPDALAMGKKPDKDKKEDIEVDEEERFGPTPDVREMAEPPLGREIVVSEELERRVPKSD